MASFAKPTLVFKTYDKRSLNCTPLLLIIIIIIIIIIIVIIIIIIIIIIKYTFNLGTIKLKCTACSGKWLLQYHNWPVAQQQ